MFSPEDTICGFVAGLSGRPFADVQAGHTLLDDLGLKPHDLDTLARLIENEYGVKPSAESARPSPSPRNSLSFAAIGPAGRRSISWSISARLCSTSRMRECDAGVDVAFRQHRHAKLNAIVGWISRRLARVESAAAGAPDITAGSELLHEAAMHDASADGAILQRSRIVIKLDKAGNRRRTCLSKSLTDVRKSVRRSAATPPGTTWSIISRCPKQLAAARKTSSRSAPQWACISENEASLQMAPISPK